MALWGMAEVRGWLKQHEESGLPAIKRPEVLQEAVAAYGTHAQVDMAIEEMSELTKALCKERRCGLGQGSRAQAHANIIEEIADVIIMLAQLLIIFDKDREKGTGKKCSERGLRSAFEFWTTTGCLFSSGRRYRCLCGRYFPSPPIRPYSETGAGRTTAHIGSAL